MYAELLELNPGPALDLRSDAEDGLPDDLDTGAWIAISGVPVGKRCLAVTYASSGIAGTGTNSPNHLQHRVNTRWSLQTNIHHLNAVYIYFSVKYGPTIPTGGETPVASLSFDTAAEYHLGLYPRPKLDPERHSARSRCDKMEGSGHRGL